jgi:hypothetical protein
MVKQWRRSGKKKRGVETQFTTKIGGETSLDSQLFCFLKFHSQLRIWCLIMPNLAVLAPESPDFTDHFNARSKTSWWVSTYGWVGLLRILRTSCVMINLKCLHPIAELQAAEIQCPVHCGFAIGFPDCVERLLHGALWVCAQSKWCWKLQVFLSRM